ncbi:hypothetical protein NC651_003676 [Populus alba x Populus x berolinensis]|nr:hypothetical protein NC651_003676 [Populus alba x Populus x berolinensis]
MDFYAWRVLHMEFKGQGANPWTCSDENSTPQEIENGTISLYFACTILHVPITVF